MNAPAAAPSQGTLAASLANVDRQFQKAVTDALSAEMKRWREKGELTVDPKLVGDRPAGSTPADSAIAKAAVSVTKALSLLTSTGSFGGSDVRLKYSKDY